MPRSRVTGVVLAAGGSRRLGTPKQLLPLGNTTLLGATLEMARNCPFDQLIVTLGAVADEVRQAVALDGLDIVLADDPGSGCSSSLQTALGWVDQRADGVVLMLGDQPGVTCSTVTKLIASSREDALAVCEYLDGVGHPFWLGRRVFGELEKLHGDKGVWRLMESGRYGVRRVPIDDAVPLDVDTWDDYRRLCESLAR
ncbi:carbon monoxide dehydrogenase [Mycobacterium sp. ACS1612]|uniref:nucleotidyltransferase family protein n=1 Tax=Mycobacterium sp. ACS1612 TaxID=1834117 RepID=UPI00080198C5|nr:NTP transferase domain-containing protein [Mycobacterium sp. ACS1612]OBF31487.1 carbon monoxide dehydrogenase [Mycobacterium sp. ACS1612]